MTRPRLLLFGVGGQLGWELARTLAVLGDITAPDSAAVDLEDAASLRRCIRECAPGVILNAAAYTEVDRAEAEPGTAHKVNAEAPGVMAEAAREFKALLVHFSTDFIFDGTKGSPYTVADVPRPLNRYGATKLEGEERIRRSGAQHLILRTSWLYSSRQGGFVSKVLLWSRRQEVLRIVNDQVGSPTWSRSLAEATAQVIGQCLAGGPAFIRQHSGTYHAADRGVVSRYDWAEAILRLDPRRSEQVLKALEPARSSEFPTPAARPAFSALDSSGLEVFQVRMPDWERSLALCLSADG